MKIERAAAAAIRLKTWFKVGAHKNVIVSENPDAAQNQIARAVEVIIFVIRALVNPRTLSKTTF